MWKFYNCLTNFRFQKECKWFNYYFISLFSDQSMIHVARSIVVFYYFLAAFDKLKSVLLLPDSVQHMAKNAFKGCMMNIRQVKLYQALFLNPDHDAVFSSP